MLVPGTEGECSAVATPQEQDHTGLGEEAQTLPARATEVVGRN